MLSVDIQKRLWQEWLKANINHLIKYHENRKNKNIDNKCSLYYDCGKYSGLDTALHILGENEEVKTVKNLLLKEIENTMFRYYKNGIITTEYVEGFKNMDIEKTVDKVLKYYDSLY